MIKNKETFIALHRFENLLKIQPVTSFPFPAFT